MRWAGEIYPNGTSPPGGAGTPPEGRNCNGSLAHVPSCQPGYGQCSQKQTCPGGACLFDIFEDPTEHHPINDPKREPIVAKMRARLAELEATYFNPDRGSSADGLAVRMAHVRRPKPCHRRHPQPLTHSAARRRNGAATGARSCSPRHVAAAAHPCGE